MEGAISMTDAEKLAAAEAAMKAAAEAAKAARLPSATAVTDLLGSEVAMAFLASLKTACEASVDDLARPLGTQGSEGTKQILQRIVTSMEAGLTAAQARVATLQPTPEPVEPPEQTEPV